MTGDGAGGGAGGGAEGGAGSGARGGGAVLRLRLALRVHAHRR